MMTLAGIIGGIIGFGWVTCGLVAAIAAGKPGIYWRSSIILGPLAFLLYTRE